ncbi:hypothetical protein ACFZ8E_26890 [Methylobacterium sp. HMF5984]|uniref:hypothetical protein n=1 Tax=Methylobacterium sp. HMF5984 TaxID=3367370 RepID=UPI003854AAE0
MKPKDLLTAAREKHPEASKKEVVRAAFYALIDSHAADPEAVKGLHAFALGERASDEDAEPKAAKLRKKKKHRKGAGDEHAAH